MAYQRTAKVLSPSLGLKQTPAGQVTLIRYHPPDGESWIQSRQPRPDRGTCMTRDEARELHAALGNLLEQY